MAKIQLRIPVTSQPLNFASRSRRVGLGAIVANYPTPYVPPAPIKKKGMGAFLIDAAPPLPARSVFPRGMGSFFIKPASRPPLPAGGVVFARGMASFFITPPVRRVLPAGSVFKGLGCGGCKRRGMGLDSSQIYSAFSSMPQYQDPFFQPQTVSDFQPVPSSIPAQLQLLPTPVNDFEPVPSSIPTQLQFPPAPTSVVPSTTNPVDQPSTNPALDAFNNALNNARSTNPALNDPSTIRQLSNAVATATPAQLATATASLSSAPSSISQISAWLAGSTLITGYANSTVLLGTGAIAALVVALASGKKGRR